MHIRIRAILAIIWALFGLTACRSPRPTLITRVESYNGREYYTAFVDGVPRDSVAIFSTTMNPRVALMGDAPSTYIFDPSDTVYLWKRSIWRVSGDSTSMCSRAHFTMSRYRDLVLTKCIPYPPTK